MTADQQQPAAAATPGPEQRVDEIRQRHRSCDCPEPAVPHCVCSQCDDCEWPPVLDALDALRAERDAARTWASLWKRTTTRYRRMLAIHRGRGWGTLAADNAALRKELGALRQIVGSPEPCFGDRRWFCGSHVDDEHADGCPWQAFVAASTPRTGQEGHG